MSDFLTMKFLGLGITCVEIVGQERSNGFGVCRGELLERIVPSSISFEIGILRFEEGFCTGDDLLCFRFKRCSLLFQGYDAGTEERPVFDTHVRVCARCSGCPCARAYKAHCSGGRKAVYSLLRCAGDS